ncbi:MAG: exodeoxyribonuclease VII large subunit [Oscillospiraceae bacterium]|nr:exodeoxyribonuclease VII large subunit [Oscillospiraceae bacterium]
MINEQQIFSVTQLNNLIKAAFDNVPALQNVCVRGEISNYKLYSSGHHYFTLKDAEGSLRCVMFKGNAMSLRFKPQNGMSVLAVGKVSVFLRDGAYQLYCSRLIPDGAGDLQMAFDQRKQRLFEEGLFDQAHKKTLPNYPHRIGVVTSPAGAAVHDMLRILGKRYPLTKVILLPVRVQGEAAAGEIARAIAYANREALCDLLIVGRGGGSVEDLWAFNEEPVARAIYASEIPVISAVGHEPDVTISDFVADLRAATPSNAAELAVPDQEELRAQLSALQKQLAAALQRKAQLARSRLDALRSSPALKDPETLIRDRRQYLDVALHELVNAQNNLVHTQRNELTRLAASLDAMSPLKVLSRGYATVADEQGSLVTSAAAALGKESLLISFRDGTVRTAVEGEHNAETKIQNL